MISRLRAKMMLDTGYKYAVVMLRDRGKRKSGELVSKHRTLEQAMIRAEKGGMSKDGEYYMDIIDLTEILFDEEK